MRRYIFLIGLALVVSLISVNMVVAQDDDIITGLLTGESLTVDDENREVVIEAINTYSAASPSRTELVVALINDCSKDVSISIDGGDLIAMCGEAGLRLALTVGDVAGGDDAGDDGLQEELFTTLVDELEDCPTEVIYGGANISDMAIFSGLEPNEEYGFYVWGRIEYGRNAGWRDASGQIDDDGLFGVQYDESFIEDWYNVRDGARHGQLLLTLRPDSYAVPELELLMEEFNLYYVTVAANGEGRIPFTVNESPEWVDDNNQNYEGEYPWGLNLVLDCAA